MQLRRIPSRRTRTTEIHSTTSTIQGGGSSGSSANKRQSSNKRRRHTCRRHLLGSSTSCMCGTPPNIGQLQPYAAVWMDLRRNTKLCDGVLICTDQMHLPIHRIILSAISSYFRALFTNSINCVEELETREAHIDATSADVNCLLDYAYSGICEITRENVFSILKLADQYEVLGLLRVCCSYLLNDMRPENCIGVWQFACQYFCHNLIKKALAYIKLNFVQVLHSSIEYVERLSFDELEQILSDDELNVRNEEQVYDALMYWVSHDSQIRQCFLIELLKCVRLGRLSHLTLETISSHSLIRNRKDCLQFLYETGDRIESLVQRGLNTVHSILFRPRICYQVLFAIGGWSSGSPTNFVETYDARADRWLLSSYTDTHPCAYHGLCVVDMLIYIVGGFDGNVYFNTLRSYDPVTHLWSECACMYQHRCYVSTVVHTGRIYAIGGFNGHARLNTMERYDPTRNQWEMMPCMRQQRSDASAAVLNNKIYVVGGFNGYEVLQSCEMYDIYSRQWTYIGPMSTPRSGVSLIVLKDNLYALGGYNGAVRLASGERYSPTDCWWRAISDMLIARSNFATVILDDYIFVIGGFDGSTTINHVEQYCSRMNHWRTVTPMNLNRSALNACVVNGLPNIFEYSVLSRN